MNVIIGKNLAKKAVTGINVICLSSSSSVSTAAKLANLLDAIHYLKMSRDNVTKDTIKNWFRKCRFTSKKSEEICEISENYDEYD